MTPVIVAVVAIVPPMAALWFQARHVHRDNRLDHAQTAAAVDGLVSTVGDMRADQLDIKADVRETRDTLRDHSLRIRDLEGK
jgi:hypothetical protein